MFKKRINELMILFWIIISIVILYIVSEYNFLLFHTILEFITFSVSLVIVYVSFISFKYFKLTAVTYLGTGFFSILILIFLHIISYHGLQLFSGYDMNLSLQFWFILGYNMSLTFLYSFIFMGKKISYIKLLLANLSITVFLIILAFLRIFPICYVYGEGLTQFKIINEYFVIAIFILALIVLTKKRKMLKFEVYRELFIAIVLICISELIFTTYYEIEGVINFIGHLFRIAGFFYILKLSINEEIIDPYEKIYQKLQHTTKTDSLTGLNKRGYFISKMDKIIYDHIINEEKLCCAIIDIDDFKAVNDTHGHLIGDEVLRELASVLKRILKEEENIGRFGGEEFIILFPEKNLREAKGTMEDLREEIDNYKFTRLDLHITISGGLTILKNNTLESFLAKADKLLYKAKNEGKNRIIEG